MGNKKIVIVGALLVILVSVLALVYFLVPGFGKGAANPSKPADDTNDPQRLLIPRWFLQEVTVDGKTVSAPEQTASIQFQPDGNVSGQGGCNTFGGSYKADKGGAMSFGQLASTMMACDKNMDLESIYLQGLARVQQFSVKEGKLTLSSSDGKVTLVFGMPPK